MKMAVPTLFAICCRKTTQPVRLKGWLICDRGATFEYYGLISHGDATVSFIGEGFNPPWI